MVIYMRNLMKDRAQEFFMGGGFGALPKARKRALCHAALAMPKPANSGTPPRNVQSL